jgi:transglutaminase-like putative cysteine protease
MVLSLGLSVLFFVLIPRVWLGQFRLFDDRPLPGGRTLTGFTEEVALGDMGEILESDDLVMEIQLFDHDTGTPVPAGEYLAELNGGEPLFRGAVLEQYVSGRWLAGRGAGPSRDPRLRSESGALRQQIRLQPIGSWTLFGVGTVLTCIPIDPDDAVFYNRSTNIFQRPANADLSRVAEYRAVSSRTDLGLTRLGNGDWGQFDRRRLARVAAQAWALTADRDGRTLSDREKAKLLEASLRDSGEFHYSLNLAIGDATIDPLVDFLFNRKQGHCEYFASALAIMLRSVDVPARVISGFKGGVYNPRTGRFEVRQLHAHAWVEAYVDGRWLPLDPTPPARDASVAEMQERTSYVWSRWNQTWKETWNRGVTLSRNDQEQLLYGPLRSTASDAWSALRDVRGSAARLAAFLRHLALSPESWISWRGGLAAFVLLIVLAGAARFLRWGWSLLRRVGVVVGDARRAARAVAFYERFRRLIAREGLQRQATQTQQEFAREVCRRLSARLAPAGLECFPEELVADFYRVRFGQQPLADSDLEDLDARLAALERALSEGIGADDARPRR